jgi:hypothetical protein
MKAQWRKNVALVITVSIVITVAAQSPTENSTSILQTPAAPGYWIDLSTGLMWAGKDNGKDANWHKATKYCHDSRLGGYSDWRLPNMAELQRMYDRTAEAPGLVGYSKTQRAFTWHVKGEIFLTGDQWSSNYRADDRGHNSGYEMYFDFNEGRPNDQPSGFPYSSSGMRALCVRGSAK